MPLLRPFIALLSSGSSQAIRHESVGRRCILAVILVTTVVLAENLASAEFATVDQQAPPLLQSEGGLNPPGILQKPFFDTPGACGALLFDPCQICEGRGTNRRPTLWNRIVCDHRNYYDLHSFRLLACGFLIAAPVANTQLDREIQDHFQTSVPGATSDDWTEFLHADKNLGDGLYTLPVYATAWAAGAIFDESPFVVATGRWGERTLRSFLVGAPPLILAQQLTGGSRPSESERGSRWLPFQDNNGVSGHAFMGASPFINAAKLTNNGLWKATLYAGSLAVPLSRLNDDAHYPSQVALGWWMAYVAASAVDRTEMASGSLQFYPYIANNSYGGAFEFRF